MTVDHSPAPIRRGRRVRGTTIADLLHQLMDRDGLVQRDLASKLEVSPATVHRLLYGLSVPTERTLSKIATAADLSIIEVRRMAGRSLGAPNPFVLPEEANQLTPRERAMVCEMIRVLLESHGPTVTRGRPTP